MERFVEVLPDFYMGTVQDKGVTQTTVNLYLIVGKEFNLLVDCGYNSQVTREFIQQGLRELKIDPGKTKLLITHAHPDHFGGVAYCLQMGMELHMNLEEFELVVASEYMSLATSLLCGITTQEYQEHISKEDVLYSSRGILHKDTPFVSVNAGDTWQVGSYNFIVQLYGGHAKNLVVLHDKEKSLLMGGDQVLLDGNPGIGATGLDERGLQKYFDSLQAIRQMDCETIFTGHGRILYKRDNSVEKALERMEQGYSRLLALLRKLLKVYGDYQRVADLVSVIYTGKVGHYFTDFMRRRTVMTKKVLAGLEYLYEQGEVERICREGVAYYKLHQER